MSKRPHPMAEERDRQNEYRIQGLASSTGDAGDISKKISLLIIEYERQDEDEQ